MIIGHSDFVEEHFVETCTTRHLAKGTNFDARGFHIDDETCEAFVLW